MEPNASQIGLSHKLWRKPTPAIARHSLHRALGPRPPVRILHTLQGFVLCHKWIFGTQRIVVLFSRILGRLHLPVGFCFLGLLWLLNTHSPAHFFVSIKKALTSLFLRCLETTPDRRCASQHQPREDLSFAMWSTMMYHFHVPFSARSVNSSGLSLTVFFGILLILSAFVLKGSQASLRCPTSNGTMIVNLYELSQPLREAFLLPSPRFVMSHWSVGDVSILLLIRQQLQCINQIPAEALRYCMRSEDLGLVNTLACLHHQEPVWLLPTIFAPQIAHNQFVCFFTQRPTKRSLPSGNCRNAGTSMTL